MRSTDERAVLTGLAVDPDDAMPPTDPEFSSTLGIPTRLPVAGGEQQVTAGLNDRDGPLGRLKRSLPGRPKVASPLKNSSR